MNQREEVTSMLMLNGFGVGLYSILWLYFYPPLSPIPFEESNPADGIPLLLFLAIFGLYFLLNFWALASGVVQIVRKQSAKYAVAAAAMIFCWFIVIVGLLSTPSWVPKLWSHL